MPRDTTPLLAAAGSLPGSNVSHDHPPFLRASHSPWECIPQTCLVRLRAFVLILLIGSGIIAFYYKFTEFRDHPISYLLFHFGSLSFVLCFIWHLLTFGWTFTHLYFPEPEGLGRGIGSLFVRAMSLPSNMGSPQKQFCLTMFYSTATVFALMSFLLFWFVTRPHNPDASAIDGPFTDLFGVGWFKASALLSLYTMPAVVMITEILFFNSIKCPQDLVAHVVGLMILSGIYLGWAGLGGHVTGCYPFYWLNPDYVGSREAVAAYCIGFIALAPLMFVLKQGFVGLREGLTNAPARTRQVVRETYVDN